MTKRLVFAARPENLRKDMFTEPELRAALRELYGDPSYVPRVFRDAGAQAFPGVSLIERSVAILASQLGGDFLDVGCGRQPYAGYFTHVKSKRGCDMNPDRGAVDFTCPAHAIPMPDKSVDSILCTEVLEHVPNPGAVWAEFARLLRPRGKVLLTTPMYWPAHEEPFDFYRYTGPGLMRLAEDAGFAVLKLYPRGGVWAFLAQAFQHSLPQYLRFAWQRRLVTSSLLRLDKWRCNPRVTIGWTVLAERAADA